MRKYSSEKPVPVSSFFESKHLTLALFAVYAAALVWIIVFKFGIEITYTEQRDEFNLIPYQRPLVLNGKVSYGEILLNVLIFIPFGLYLATLFEKWGFSKALALFILSSFILEATQYILGIGAFDVTDIINNSLGGIIGWTIYKGTVSVFKNREKIRKYVNLISLGGTVCTFSFLAFLKINQLWIFRM
jgi:glycopeptide antibiotics resistance protein